MSISQEIANSITAKITDAKVAVGNPHGDGQHFEAIIISSSFENIILIARHRKVYEALGNAFENKVHALKLTTLTPNEAIAKGIDF